jgi:hypothetical protein
MHRADRVVDAIHFGSDEHTLFLRIDIHQWQPMALEIRFHEPAGCSVRTGVLHRREAAEWRLRTADGWEITRGDIVVREAIKLAIPLAVLGLAGEASVAFQVRLFGADGIERECYPETAPIQFTLLGLDFALRNWIV